jgi:hypothetical protein
LRKGGEEEVSVLNTFHNVHQLLKKYSAPWRWIQNTQYIVGNFYRIITINGTDSPLRLLDYHYAPSFCEIPTVISIHTAVKLRRRWKWRRRVGAGGGQAHKDDRKVESFQTRYLV